MVSDKKLANAVGGKTVRACDSCIRKRARWYCAADDAFLCQACDSSVHSANPLASRHERLRLKTASVIPSPLENSLPSWNHGFTRKARTPRRHGKQAIHRQQAKSDEPIRNPLHHLVPEISHDETSHEENEEQLLYRVPIFDPFAAELCVSANSTEPVTTVGNDGKTMDAVGNDESKHDCGAGHDESKAMLHDCGAGHDVNSLHGLLPSNMDLEEFAADVESLLGKALDDEETFDMEGLGLLDCREKDSMEGSSSGSRRVKVEEEEDLEAAMANQVDHTEIDITKEPFELNFDYDSPLNYDEDVKVGTTNGIVKGCEDYEVSDVKKKVFLTLNYDGVMAAWAGQRSPWTTGDRPELDPNDCWPECMGACGTIHHIYGNMGIMGGQTAMLDGGREARVSRYREKRRTRLFSKKIRYEVRKLNAEKRPRMKGRFVKRANFAGTAFP